MRILAGVLATAGLLAWTHGAAAALPRFEPSYPLTVTSSNWSGYSLTAKPRGSYKSVSAQWSQPSADCGAQDAPESYAAIWVGLDGDGSNTVEQTGTEIDCLAGQASLSAWIEMYPNPPLTLDLPINAGDRISAAVTYLGRYRYRLTISNLTSGKQHTQVSRSTIGRRKSAEVIVEAPSSLFSVLPLAHFADVTLSAATVDGLPIGSRVGVERINMADEVTGAVKAFVSPLLTPDSFSVGWVGP